MWVIRLEWQHIGEAVILHTVDPGLIPIILWVPSSLLEVVSERKTRSNI